MNASEPASPSNAGSKLLARFSDTDSLFVKSRSETVVSRPNPIPLQRTQELEQAIRHSPALPEPYIELGQIYLQQERWTDARRILEGGRQNCPENEPILLMHEDLILILASQLLEQAKLDLAQNPSNDTRYAKDQAEINLVNERIRICRERFKRRPDEKEILITWAIALRQIQKYEEAVSILEQAAACLNLRSRASLQLGMCLRAMDRPLEALAAFRRASLFRSPPTDPRIACVALEMAADLAEELGLIDSSIYYLQNLVVRSEASERAKIQSQIDRLLPLLPQPPRKS